MITTHATILVRRSRRSAKSAYSSSWDAMATSLWALLGTGWPRVTPRADTFLTNRYALNGEKRVGS